MFESERAIHWTTAHVKEWLEEQLAIESAVVKSISPLVVQQLTHQQISGQFIHIELASIPVSLKSLDWIQEKQMSEFAFPRLINGYLEAIPNKKTS